MSTEATEAARKWYEKTYPFTMATSSKVLCEEDIDMLAAYASTLTDENAKLRALVQKILDLSFHDSECHITEFGGPCDCLKSVIDAAAKEQGFTPTNTETPTSEGSTTQ